MLPAWPGSDRPTQRRWITAAIWLGLAVMLGSWLLEDQISSGSATTLPLIGLVVGLGIVILSVIVGGIPYWCKQQEWKRSAREEGFSRREIRRSTGLTVGYWITMFVAIWLVQYLIDFVASSPHDVGRVVLAVTVVVVVGVMTGKRLEVVAAAARTREGITLSGWWTSAAGIRTTLVLSIAAIIAALLALLAWPDRSGLRIVAMIVAVSAASGGRAAITRLRSPPADKPVDTPHLPDESVAGRP